MAAEEKPKILAVDDEVENLSLLKRALRSEFDVVTCTSAEEALTLFEDYDFSVILSDQRMPGMVGTEFLSETLKLQPSAIRILITGYSDIDSVIAAVNEGSIHRYIKKPWRKEELLKEIANTRKMLELIVENQSMVRELKDANKKLEQQKRLLMQNLDETSKELFVANQELKEMNSQLHGQSMKDGLTNLYNHRAFQQRLREETARTLRNEQELSLIFIDVDHFKNYNDTNGHKAGDRLLQEISKLLTSSSRTHNAKLRCSDIISRYGGEEFAAILPDTQLEGGKVKAERIRKAIEELEFEGREKQPLKKITVSIGVASFPGDASTPDDLVQKADEAMYASKHGGRNRTTLYRDMKKS